MVLEKKLFSVEELSTIVEKELSQLPLPSNPKNLYEPINHILGSGGKRIRPVLVLAACNLFSDEIDQAINSALAIEVFHNFTLVHDDIMDNAQKRRGVDTVHIKWDRNVAILSGDAMSIFAYSLLSKTQPTHLSSVLRVFNDFSLGICEGQQLDMDFESCSKVSIEDYLKMIELKTSVLIKGALQIGAILGSADNQQIDNIGSFGLNLGLAFQLQDDLLDFYGDPKIFGKKIGGDILAKKKTILFLNAIGQTTNNSELIQLYNDDKITIDDKIKKLDKLFNYLKIREITENQISEYYKKAQISFNGIDVDNKRKQVLETIAKNIMKRDK